MSERERAEYKIEGVRKEQELWIKGERERGEEFKIERWRKKR